MTKGVNHGVHAFYMDLRDPETKEFLPGIGGEDDGVKGGLNGIDNGRLHFTNVRIPRTNLLNRYGNVDAEGNYTSPIASPGRRFFTMLGTLVQGRVSLDGAAVTASKLALKTAIQYATERRQFNASSQTDEEVLLDYQRHQRRLLHPAGHDVRRRASPASSCCRNSTTSSPAATTPTRTARTSKPWPRPSSR